MFKIFLIIHFSICGFHISLLIFSFYFKNLKLFLNISSTVMLTTSSFILIFLILIILYKDGKYNKILKNRINEFKKNRKKKKERKKIEKLKLTKFEFINIESKVRWKFWESVF